MIFAASFNFGKILLLDTATGGVLAVLSNRQHTMRAVPEDAAGALACFAGTGAPRACFGAGGKRQQRSVASIFNLPPAMRMMIGSICLDALWHGTSSACDSTVLYDGCSTAGGAHSIRPGRSQQGHPGLRQCLWALLCRR